jgi:hypothetical protein
MSDAGMHMYVSQTSVDTSEEEALECARKDLIKLLNLQVPGLMMNRFLEKEDGHKVVFCNMKTPTIDFLPKY